MLTLLCRQFILLLLLHNKFNFHEFVIGYIEYKMRKKIRIGKLLKNSKAETNC